MSPSDPEHLLTVTAEESGQKLLQYLVRRLNLSQTLLHRWIRTGQIRCNGGRVKPFDRVAQGDVVRLPPFARAMAQSAQFERKTVLPAAQQQENKATEAPSAVAVPSAPFGESEESAKLAASAAALPRIRSGRFSPAHAATSALLPPPAIREQGEIWAFNKPAGLPVQPGTGHADSIATRLSLAYAHKSFVPTPAHRLDRETSGVLLVGASYRALRFLQEAFKAHSIVKEYLAWVEGRWAHASPRLLCHSMEKKHSGIFEKMHTGTGKDAACIVAPLCCQGQRSLLHIRLITGRTHQIRAQLSACGYPLLGDAKYGSRVTGSLYLHALRIILPAATEADRSAGLEDSVPQAEAGRTFLAAPPWEGDFAPQALPAPLTDAACQGMIADYR
ncbi:MAG: RluA family pseudouridine synthase [Desulfovibrionaceae bacterium]|nr:RluA family pseudouridine synthase [Desulfovibrionaceae bacterium]